MHEVRADGSTDHENFLADRVWEKPIANDLSMCKFRVSKAWHPQDLSSEPRQESFILVKCLCLQRPWLRRQHNFIKSLGQFIPVSTPESQQFIIFFYQPDINKI